MSRVQYSTLNDAAGQELLRAEHRVRLVSDAEEGTPVRELSPGVYGFTYSPGLPNAPLFAVRRYRAYEIHKVAAGETFIVAFADRDTASRIESSSGDVVCRVHSDATDAAYVVVKIPYSRIRQHRQYAAPNQDGLAVTLTGSQNVKRESAK